MSYLKLMKNVIIENSLTLPAQVFVLAVSLPKSFSQIFVLNIIFPDKLPQPFLEK